MMWFFAILVVLVMGGVAAVAAGRGAPMSDAYDDRPDALVPRDGPLAADDIRRVRFSLAFRGYRMSEVDALLDRIATQLDGQPDGQPDGQLDGQETRAPEPADTPDTAGQAEVGDTPEAREPRGDEPSR